MTAAAIATVAALSAVTAQAMPTLAPLAVGCRLHCSIVATHLPA